MASVAFLGLGVMGYPMAGYLASNGHDVKVYNRTAAKSAEWVKQHGGTACATPKEAAAGCDFVMACVGNDDDLRSIVQGDDGAFAGMAAGATFVDHTTASATVARELYAVAAAKNVAFLDAPISGGQAGAESGQLTVMVGGDQAPYDQAEPLMQHYSKSVRLMGTLQNAQVWMEKPLSMSSQKVQRSRGKWRIDTRRCSIVILITALPLTGCVRIWASFSMRQKPTKPHCQ